MAGGHDDPTADHADGGERVGALGLGSRPRFVVTRDGRAASYDPERIAAAVARAQASLGESDPAFAADVATVVELSLRRRAAGRRGEVEPPHVDEIQDLVEQALIELGAARLAKAYILARYARARAREQLTVRSTPPDGVQPPLGGVRVREAERTAPWSKARIAAALVAEADLARTLAEEVAERVERRVFASGLASLSTGLIRALVDNELVALGQTAALARHAPLTVARHDVRRALAGEGAGAFEAWSGVAPRVARPGDVAAMERVLGGEVLRRYALDEVLDPRSAQLHLEGELHVEDLGAPHLFLTLGVPAELALGTFAPDGGAFGLLEPLGSLLGAVSRSIQLEDTGALVGELARATRPRSPLGLAGWLCALGGIGAASGRRIDLASPGPRHAAARARLVEELVREESAAFAPRLVLDDVEYAELADESAAHASVLERLAHQGRLVLAWGSGDATFAAPGCERRVGERGLVACGGAVALNLPRLARRAGPWREERLLEELSGLISCALEACRSLAAFQHGAANVRPGPVRPRIGYALVPVGLKEALRIFGQGEIDPALGARLLGLMDEAARRFPAPGAPPVRLAPFFGERAARRLAWLDAGSPGLDAVRQGELFGGAASVAAPESYGTGFALSPLGGWRDGEGEAELTRTVPVGALHPLTDRGHTRAPIASAALARFARARAERPPRRDAWLPGWGAGADRPADGAERDLLVPSPRRSGAPVPHDGGPGATVSGGPRVAAD